MAGQVGQKKPLEEERQELEQCLADKAKEHIALYQKYKKLEAFHEEVLASLGVGVWSYSWEHAEFALSFPGAQLLRIASGQPLKLKDFLGAFSTPSQQSLLKAIAHAKKTQQGFRVDVARLDRPQWFEITGQWALDANQVPYVWGALQEVTERKRSEDERDVMVKQLYEKARLSAFAMMVAGLAHDINNPLTAIKGYAQVLTARLKRSAPELLDVAGHIVLAAGRIHEHMGELRGLFEKSPMDQKAVVKLGDVIRKAKEFFRSQWERENIVVELRAPSSENDRVFGNSLELELVFQNLMASSFQALAANPHAHAKVLIEWQIEGDYVGVRYEDNGGGLSLQEIESFFDPIRSLMGQKNRPGAHGLGVAHEIIKSHGGRISIHSHHPHTSFVISLPRFQERNPLESSLPNDLANRDAILVLDSDRESVDLLKAYLSRRYQVKAFGSLTEVPSAVLGEISLVMADISRSTDPKATLEELQKIFSKVPLIALATKGVFLRNDRGELEQLCARLILKPYSSVSAVLAHLEELLRPRG